MLIVHILLYLLADWGPKMSLNVGGIYISATFFPPLLVSHANELFMAAFLKCVEIKMKLK